MSEGDLIQSCVILAAIALALLCTWYEKKAGIVPAPVLPWVRWAAIRLLQKHVGDHKVQKIGELGCGWGGMVKLLARRFPQAHITGYEISPAPYVISRLRTCFMRKRVTITRRDFFTDDLSRYDLIFCYLSPRHMEKLKPQLATLKPGSLIVSCSFPIPGWTPLDSVTVWSLVRIPVCLYRVAAL